MRNGHLGVVTTYFVLILPDWPDSLLVSDVLKVKRYGSELLIVLNGNQGLGVVQFDAEGRFIQSFFNQGDGTGSHQRMDDVVLSDSVLYVLNRSKQLIYLYQWPDNKYKGSLPLRGLFVQAMAMSGNILFLYSGNEENTWGSKIHVLDPRTGQFISHYFKNDPGKKFINVFEANNFINLDQALLFYYAFNDTIYTLDAHGPGQVEKYIDFGMEGIGDDVWQRPFKDIYSFRTYLQKTDYAYFVMNYDENDSYLLFNYQQGDNFPLVIKNKQSGEGVTIAKWVDDLGTDSTYVGEALFDYFTKRRLMDDHDLWLGTYPQLIPYPRFQEFFEKKGWQEDSIRKYYEKNNPCFMVLELSI